MNLSYMGALLVILGCGGFGFSMAAAYRREERLLRQLMETLQFFQWELSCRLTPLPELCRMAASLGKGSVPLLFSRLSRELEDGHAPEVSACMYAALRHSDLSPGIRELLSALGRSLGRFDLDGQLQGLNEIKKRCCHQLEALQNNRTDRLRSYQTLGLCAGVALVILFL